MADPQTGRTRGITFPLGGWIESYLLDLRAARRSPYTLRSYATALRRFEAWAVAAGYGQGGFEALSQGPHPLRAYLAHLAETPSARGGELSTISLLHYARALRIFCGWLVDQKELEANPLDGVRLPREPESRRGPLSDDELRQLLVACRANRSRVTALRDVAIVLTLLDTGLRVSELCSLRTEAFTASGALTVVGKGDKQRTVHIGPRTLKAILAYRREAASLSHGEWLFVGQRGPLQPKAVGWMLARRSERAGIPRVSPHRLRHSFAVNWLRGGGDVATLKALLGHTSLTMVLRYVKLSELDLAEAHRRHSPVDRLKL